MMVLLATLSIFVLAMAAMAIGVMISGRRLQGSCGGSGNGGYGCHCDAAKREVCARKQGSVHRQQQPRDERPHHTLDVLPD